MEYSRILETVIDNGRVTAHTKEAFEAELKAEIEFECLERGLSSKETEESVKFAIRHASL